MAKKVTAARRKRVLLSVGRALDRLERCMASKGFRDLYELVDDLRTGECECGIGADFERVIVLRVKAVHISQLAQEMKAEVAVATSD